MDSAIAAASSEALLSPAAEVSVTLLAPGFFILNTALKELATVFAIRFFFSSDCSGLIALSNSSAGMPW